MMNTPYDLEDKSAYEAWRDRKLDRYPGRAEELVVEVRDYRSLRTIEKRKLFDTLGRANCALLQCNTDRNIYKECLHRLGPQLGLHRLDDNLCADEDAISSLRVLEKGRGTEYIPYTNRPLSWHTDGYYNAPERRVRSWALLCAQDAAEGGENGFLDHEILYILLRERDPAMIQALMQADAMSIPANRENGVEIRPRRTGPVFSVDPADGTLHMRYSARGRNIDWRDDAQTRAARDFIQTLFSSGSDYIYRHRLEPGQCLLSNNILHRRSGFRDTPERSRLVYRARYHDRIRADAAC